MAIDPLYDYINRRLNILPDQGVFRPTYASPVGTEQQPAQEQGGLPQYMDPREMVVQSLAASQQAVQNFRPYQNRITPKSKQATGEVLQPQGEGGKKGHDHSHGGGKALKNGQNGRLKDDQLVSIGGGHKLQPAAAAAWQRMKAAAAKDGVNLTITDSYRTYDAQVRLAKEKGLYSQGGLAATPGRSNHGWGLAVDVTNGREWLAKHGNKFGFHTIPREPWHWEYRG